jgi:tellurium resistance protein TerD
MALNLKKGGSLNLRKEAPGLSNVIVELAWVSKDKSKVVDLDASALLLGANGKMWAEDSIVYYQKGYSTSPDGAVVYGGDDRGGGDEESEESNEEIKIDLKRVDSKTQTIMCVITSYSEGAPEHFGKVRSASARIKNGDTGAVIGECDLAEDMSGFTSMAMAKLTRDGDNWKFEIVGQGLGKSAIGLEDAIARY